MNNLEAVVTKMKRDIELKYVYVMMKPDELQTLIDEIEALREHWVQEREVAKLQKEYLRTELVALQRELDEKDDAISYAMNQIQIKETHIRNIEKDHKSMKETLENIGYSGDKVQLSSRYTDCIMQARSVLSKLVQP